MVNTRIKISSIISNQLPSFVRNEFPLVQEFLKQYYNSIENQGSCLDLLQNIDQYVKVDNLSNLIETTNLSVDIFVFDKEIKVASTAGFPDSYGLLLIDNEIITYESKTSTSFENCSRGFSGVTSLIDNKKVDQLVFKTSEASDHLSGSEVKNLSILFLKEFFKKIKKQILPGLEDQNLYEGLNQRLFLKHSKDFYSSKGTSSSFKILFKALYGDFVEFIRPSDYLIKPSNAQYRVTQDLVVEAISGDPISLLNGTLYQDSSEYTKKASGTITNVERIDRGGKDYYVLSFDYDYNKDLSVEGTVYGDFIISPKTKTITDTIYDATVIDVDSTAGFPVSGKLQVILKNGGVVSISYGAKTLTQFLKCTGINEEIDSDSEIYLDVYAYGYVGISTQNIVKVRVTGVLSDLKVPSNTKYYSENDLIEIQTLGSYKNDYKFNNWFYNISANYDVEKIKLIDSSDATYRFTVYDDHVLYPGDKIKVIPSYGGESASLYGLVVSVENKKNFTSKIYDDNFEIQQLNDNLKFKVEKILSRVDSNNYKELSVYTSNVQNVYVDENESLYVASPSLPTYLNQSLSINNRSVVFSGTFEGDELNVGEHKFYTGDSVIYVPGEGNNTLNIKKGIYFVYKVNSTIIKLSRSRENIFTKTFISVYGTVTNNQFILSNLTSKSLEIKKLEPQRLIRNIKNPESDRVKNQTLPGSIGIFVNGVELYNYKSNDTIYYGPLEKIGVLAPGQDYDVINPPIVNIIDSEGYGAEASCSIIGSLKRIDIIDPGFNYIEEPKIKITGGNGKNATSKVNLIQYDHSSYFNSQVESGVNIATNTIGFSTFHKFKNSEVVIYNSDGQTQIGGLVNNASYYVKLINEYSIRLYNSLSDSITGINTVNITSYGVGTQKLTSLQKKRKISSITIENEGHGYQSKERTVSSSGINTSTDTIKINNHGYSSGEVVSYYPGTSVISGLSTGLSYYVTKIDDDNFKLSQLSEYSDEYILKTSTTSGRTVAIGGTIIYVDITSKISVGNSISISGKLSYAPVTGVGSTFITIGAASTIGSTITAGLAVTFTKVVENKYQDLYYKTKQYIKFANGGSGTHAFNYPPIKLSLVGNTGSSVIGNQDLNAKLQPIFRGSVESIFLKQNGSNYGSEEILNYNRQPQILLESGSGAQLTPVISGGRIVNVIINKSGSGYNSPPTLVVKGGGIGALLTPIIKDGLIYDVNIITSGGSYGTETTIDVVPAGSGAKLQSFIKTWRVNNVERLIISNQITDDDGFITNGLNDNYGLQYSHLYSPRKLRASVLSTKIKDGDVIYVPDIQVIENKEANVNAHSPVIGWAYDGNPIYGPNAYTSQIGGVIRTMKSGYTKILKEYRPRTELYPLGFFVEDYDYTASGDLDEHNGRFCITPEYPNGVYAYFCTINNLVESSGSFNNYKKPVFPYVIGNYYKSKPIEFNFNALSNQDYIDINQTGWLRNTYPYNLLNSNSNYKYLSDSNLIKRQIASISGVEIGGVDSVGIFSGGHDYRINDEINFETEEYGKNSALAKVSEIKGKKVESVQVQTSSIENIEFLTLDKSRNFIGFCTDPHNLFNNDLVNLTTEYNNKSSGKIIISENTLVLTTGIQSTYYTGIVTYFNVSGNLDYPSIRENDIYEIGNERVKVINVDKKSSRIKVIRNYNGTSGLTSHFAGDKLVEISRKFQVTFGISTSYNFDLNKTIYFDPKESVGIGTSVGVGIVSTLYFSNPGVGITQISIPTRAIYLPDHKLRTGTKLVYSSNGGTRVSVSTNGTSSFQLVENSLVYVSRLSNDLIGISTIRVGLGSTGSYSGIGSVPSSILYFVGIGTGEIHSFKTYYDNVLTGDITKNIVTVSTATTHGLSLGDKINLDVRSGITTSIKIKYNDNNRRLICNSRSFSSSDVDRIKDIIKIQNHSYFTGQKILYTASSVINGLKNQSMYYVVVVDDDRIKLSNSYYQATKSVPEIIDLKSSSAGTISEINPPIKAYKNNRIIFDLSDSSLSYSQNSIVYSAYKLLIYSDSDFKNEFNSTQKSASFEVKRQGRVGIDTFASVTLYLNDDVPSNLYYRLEPISLNDNKDVKKQIIIDNDVLNRNQILISESKYTGSYSVVGVASTSFNLTLSTIPERDYYSSSDSEVNYTTNSTEAYGEINKIDLVRKGKYYRSIPGITKIITNSGEAAILIPNTNNIGRIKSIQLQDIGFNYPSDITLRPTAKLPTILKLEAFSSLDKITVVKNGKNYVTPPSLVVIDGLTNEIVDDIDLEYKLDKKDIKIFKNTKGINNITPRIVPINNSNGVGISSITFNDITKEVTVNLNADFYYSSAFPFVIGDEILIENISVGINSTGKGYNSSNYDYQYFNVTGVNTVGATINFNLLNYLNSGEYPGTYDKVNSSGRVVPTKHMPVFDVSLKKNHFFVGEVVESVSSKGKVQSWDETNEILKVSSSVDTFKKGDRLKGLSSNSDALIKEVIYYNVPYEVTSSSNVRKGWKKETGQLSNNSQRIHDSNYYQNFAYAIKSKTDFSKWDTVVDNLNHTVGFKKFSDLIVESTPNFSGIRTDQNTGEFTAVTNIYNVIDLECVNDFDLVRENNIVIDDKIKSNRIIFNERVLQDYIESIGNRVLIIDDISPEFSSLPRIDVFNTIDSFKKDYYRYKKYFIFIQDIKFAYEKQFCVLNVIHDNDQSFINQYGKVFSYGDLGSFDASIIGEYTNVNFYPINKTLNEYSINTLSFSLGNLLGINQVNYTIDSSKYTTTGLGVDAEFNILKDGISYQVTIIQGGTGFQVNDLINIQKINLGGSNDDDGFITLRVTGVQEGLPDVFDVIQFVEVVGNSTLNIGNIARISTNSSLINSGTSNATTVVGISTLYRASKVLVQIGSTSSTSSYYESTELTYIHDNNQVRLLEYGTINTSNSISSSSSGIGTYSAYIDSSQVKIDFIPNQSLQSDLEVNVLSVSIADKSIAGSGSSIFQNAIIKSTHTNIPSSPSPTETTIAQYDSSYGSGYYLVCIENTTNNNYQVSEIIVVNGDDDVSIVEFGKITTSNGFGIGTCTASISGSNVNLRFTPLPNINVQARVFQVSQSILNSPLDEKNNIHFKTSSIEFNNSSYRGTEIDVKRSFELKHRQKPIFKRYFDVEETNIVNLEDSTITITDHFFVTGEEVTYSKGNSSFDLPIGITTTVIGVGATNLLPSTLYIVKVDDTKVRVSASASEALKTSPNTLKFTSTGSGNFHSLTSKTQNSRVIINIDNVIQTPLVQTPIKETLVNEIKLSDGKIKLSGVTTFFAGDLLKVEDEIMRITTVGLGSTNVIAVQRGWMGTGIVTHSSNLNVAKIVGDFNIIDNTIHFISAPYGKIPLFTPSDRPDEKDYIGLETGSIFSGRAFIRSGVPNTNEKSYAKNYVFDDLTDSINGITTQFILKSNNANISGFSTGNSVLLVNNIFQSPARLGAVNVEGDYNIKETSGITSIRFTGRKTTNNYDVNDSTIPVGGLIVSIASTAGFNYQTLVSAGGTPITSVANTVTSVSIANSGSGYRVSKTYQLNSKLSSNVGIGSTIIYINNLNSFYKVLEFTNTGSNCSIGIGTFINNATITSVGSTFVRISVASSSNYNINSGNTVTLTINNPTVGFVNVSVAQSSLSYSTETHVGIATIYNGSVASPVFITSSVTAYRNRVGIGSTSIGPSIIKFEEPLEYSNIPLVYSSSSIGKNIGTGAVIDISVGYGKSVTRFELKNYGFGYDKGEILTVQSTLDSLYGIPVNDSFSTSNEFRITIDSVHKDKVIGWTVGDFQVFDPIDDLFDGSRVTFPLSINNVQTTIRSRRGSLIDVSATLLIFINDILQLPGNSYRFDGGSNITFNNPPRNGDTSKIIFYRGTGSVDTKDVDITQTIKVGDEVTITSDEINLGQTERLVTEIVSTDEVQTVVYPGPGISLDYNIERPLKWCKQRYDRIVDGKYVAKDRESYETWVHPTSYLIKPVGLSTNEFIFVDNIKTFFDNFDEYGSFTSLESRKIQILSQEPVVGASATAVVSIAGTISSIVINNRGLGYKTAPEIYIQNPTGLGVTQRALAVTEISYPGSISSIRVTGAGTGYYRSNPPLVFIAPPKPTYEEISNVEYSGDFGVVVGISTSKIGISYDSAPVQISSGVPIPNLTGFFIAPNLRDLYFTTGTPTATVYRFQFFDGFDISAIGVVSSISVNSFELNPQGIFFKPDGKKMYIVGESGDDVNEQTLSTAWDITTASSATIGIAKTVISLASSGDAENQTRDIFINDTGTKVYVLGAENSRVYQFTLTQGWNFSTLVYTASSIGTGSTSFSIASQEEDPTGMTFSSDGKKLYVIGTNSVANSSLDILGGENRIHQYSLSSPWEIRSASYDNVSYLHSADSSSPQSLQFSPNIIGTGTTENPEVIDGSLLFTLVANSSNISLYNLNNYYNICENRVQFDLHIPNNSFLRDPSVVGTAITLSGIQTGYYLSIYNSNINKKLITVNNNGTLIGIGSTFFDNVYQVESYTIENKNIVGIGTTNIVKVSCYSYNNIPSSLITSSSFYGEYSWGRIYLPDRLKQKEFNTQSSNITNSPIVRRINPLKYRNYFA